MANTATDAGEVMTPEQIAKEALKDVTMSINANSSNELDVVARYFNKETLVNVPNPEAKWKENRNLWRREALKKLIEDKAKTISEYMASKERSREATDAYIQVLMSKGYSYSDARKKATGK